MFQDPGKSFKSSKWLSCFGSVFVLNIFCLQMPWPFLISVFCFYVFFIKYILLSLNTLIFVQSYCYDFGWWGPEDKDLNLCSGTC